MLIVLLVFLTFFLFLEAGLINENQLDRITSFFSTDEDFQYFVLEKATNMDFTEPEVIQTADTSYSDVNFTANQTNYYRLTAVDYAGNHSETSPIVEATIMLSIDDGFSKFVKMRGGTGDCWENSKHEKVCNNNNTCKFGRNFCIPEVYRWRVELSLIHI